jgi:tryptophanyl-tRNA synthetase
MRRTGILMAWKFNFPDSISQVRISARRRQEKISSSAIFSEIFLNSSEVSAKKVSTVKFQVLEDEAQASRPRHPDCRRAAPQRYSLANITVSIAAWSSGESFLPCAVR